MISAIQSASVTAPGTGLASGPQAAGPAAGPGFGEVLAGLVNNASATLRQGEAAAVAGIQGQMTTQAVVEQVLAAERTLQAVTAIRDKAVGAYLEVSRMQI